VLRALFEERARLTVTLYILAAAAAAYWGVPFAAARLSRRALRRKAARAGALVLTFDDGPGKNLTPRILDRLAAAGVRASFFVLGANAERHGDLLRRIDAAGHEICLHGYSHLDHWKAAPWRAIADIRRGRRALDAALGESRRARSYRPPRGRLNLVSLVYLFATGAPVVYWSADGADTWMPPSRRDAGRVARKIEESGGAVVLLHDFDRADRATDEFVMESLERTLAVSERLGLKSMTVGELVGGCVNGKPGRA
jgi:peptidoglycan/xylan/chitin deacetylase (PgdA/CDA1 family)